MFAFMMAACAAILTATTYFIATTAYDAAPPAISWHWILLQSVELASRAHGMTIRGAILFPPALSAFDNPGDVIDDNIAIGVAGRGIATGSSNITIGTRAFENETTGSNNVHFVWHQ